VSYFAATLARRSGEWTGEETDLREVEDLDQVLDEMRRVDDEAQTLLLVVEEDDEWFAIVRLDEDRDPRVFLSDVRAVETSTLGAMFGEAAVVTDADDADDDDDEGAADDDDDDEPGGRTSGDPIGDIDVLADLGTSSTQLLKLCAEEGRLPADVLSALCETAGCLEALDGLRLA
jgi:putative tRNA adenosine deaminase-associated protein